MSTTLIQQTKEDGVSPVYIGNGPSPKFLFVDYNQPHWKRKKIMMDADPAVMKLFKSYPLSSLYIVLIVLLQTVLTYFFKDSSYWILFLASYTIGAVADHAMWVLIHDCTHNVVLNSRYGNLFLHLVANIPLVWPSTLSFRYYHLMHHSNLNTAYGDPDVPSALENKIFGSTALGKTIWLCFFPYIQSARILRFKSENSKGVDPWIVANFLIQIIYTGSVYYFWGFRSVAYLTMSSTFALGLHPLGARWIAEHYAVEPKQETYSYYGILNKLAFNIGYHNEHHDFPQVPWVYLPQLKKRFPLFYTNLISHDSYIGVLYKFIFDPNFTLETRVVRPFTDKRNEVTTTTTTSSSLSSSQRKKQ